MTCPLAACRLNLIYSLIRAARPSAVVEFGTSFGISTIHLAAAVRDNEAGHVISTELNAAKVARATANIAEAGLADWVTILEGDARQTRARPGPVQQPVHVPGAGHGAGHQHHLGHPPRVALGVGKAQGHAPRGAPDEPPVDAQVLAQLLDVTAQA